MKTKQEIKQYFENGNIPNQEQFWDWQDAYWHKEESIAQDNISGLKDAFNTKMNRPQGGTGFYIIAQNGDISNYSKLNLQSYNIPYWNGSSLTSSSIYHSNDKTGIGTLTPSETLEVAGNIKSTGLIVSNLPAANINFSRNLVAKDDGTIGWEVKSTSSGTYIPLSGTEAGKPISGNLELMTELSEENSSIYRDNKDTGVKNEIGFYPSGMTLSSLNTDQNVMMSRIDLSNDALYVSGPSSQLSMDQWQTSLVYRNGRDMKGIIIDSNIEQPIVISHIASFQKPRGLTGVQYYGDNAEPDDYIQKQYVDKKMSYTRKEERTEGTWINGKPVYRQSLYFDQIPASGEIDLEREIPAIETIVSNEMFTEWRAFDTAFAGNQWRNQIFITVDSRLIKIQLIKEDGYDYSGIDSFSITLEYTKK
ncbi:hypothetical protein ACM46_02325 [Chryseobacterium angstadtii]|uniref:Uncharacterized protein n=1 Tax=Chryseobacterium angstadtii TaxID=558151 RepID=A0A0J7IJ33_9FLAO|nr:hypothetical protein [Chryseobacterium angstadtii]KMQ66393.1 hypothetical protein ACM46_02325 [Chryseobacterium angstadtii]